MRIGLFYQESVDEVLIEQTQGEFFFTAQGKRIHHLKSGDRVRIFHHGGTLVGIKINGEHKGRYKRVGLERVGKEGSFRLRKGRPLPVDRLYPGELIVKAERGSLQLINRVSMPEYIAGVVAAESGSGHHPEYYKVQAIICRTYALHDLDKFRDQGYHLCDKVACQVYKGKNTKEPLIDSAVKETKGIVIVDDDIELITAAFHSNSGGHTVPSEDVWTQPLPYLKGLEDPFSMYQPHYQWQRKIPKEEWLNYLEREFEYPVKDPFFRDWATDYCPEERKVCFAPSSDSILLNTIRMDLGLGSTYFTITEEQDTVVFRGKGYGHGIGLSQEGAMRMAELGIPYQEILHYYYKNVHLVKMSALDFFRN